MRAAVPTRSLAEKKCGDAKGKNAREHNEWNMNARDLEPNAWNRSA